jgi:putative phage-type endonuclease
MESNLDFTHQQGIVYENIPKSLKELMKIPQYPQKSEEWFNARDKYLTASNVDSVLGYNKYSCRDEILFKKCGISKPFTGNIFTNHGNKHEDNAIAEYCKIYNKKTIDFGLLPHPSIPFLAGSPDGIAFDNDDPNSRPIVLEVKCPYSRKIEPGSIPTHYTGQLLLNMEVTGYDGCFIEYVPHGYKYGANYFINVIHVKNEHAKNWFKDALPILESFWKDVEKYRTEGIDTHPDYKKWYNRCRKKNVIDI